MTVDPKAIERLPELVVEFFNRCGDEPELSERMSFADTSVHIHFTDPDQEDEGCTIWLDRTPIGAEQGLVGNAEIELFAPRGVYLDLFVGRDKLPMAIVHGDVAYTGPVRKFLRVTPILTSFDFQMFRQEQGEFTSVDAPPPSKTGFVSPREGDQSSGNGNGPTDDAQQESAPEGQGGSVQT